MLQKKQVTYFDFDFKACMCYVSEALSWISCCKTFYTFCKADLFYQRLSLHVLLLPLQVPMNSTLPRRFRNLQTIYQAKKKKKKKKNTHTHTHTKKKKEEEEEKKPQITLSHIQQTNKQTNKRKSNHRKHYYYYFKK